MKAIMISDKPKWCALMMNGDKTVEVRKESVGKAVQKLIDENGYADIYVYCSKDDDLGCIKKISKDKYVCGKDFDIKDFNYLASGYNGKGKVVFKFRCYKVEEIKNNLAMRFFTESANEKELLKKSCLNSDQLFWYLAPQELKVKCCGYAIHISDLEIFDKPKELSEFNHWTDKKIQWYSIGEKVKVMVSLTNAPQNYCYVEVE